MTSRTLAGVGAALAAALTAACASAGPGPTVMELPGITLTLDEETYTVTGSTVAEIGRSLRQRSPYLGNRSVRGLHRYGINWRFSYRDLDGRCRVDDVQVEISSTVVLPRWSRTGAVEPELEAAWEAYLDGIRTHEEQHRQLAIQAALAIQEELSRLDAPACSRELGDRANRTGREILAEYRTRNEAFDRASFGARWPPW